MHRPAANRRDGWSVGLNVCCSHDVCDAKTSESHQPVRFSSVCLCLNAALDASALGLEPGKRKQRLGASVEKLESAWKERMR